MKRKSFLQQLTFGAGAFIAAPHIINAQPAYFGKQKSEPLSAEKVKEFVVAGHNDLDKIKAMLAETPNLLYASWDWGNGDFETALEGAGHMGRKDIADFLIKQGARPNLFVLTMLGKTDLVKQQLNLFPELLNSKGPHGFTLLHHAMQGGDDAKALLAYLDEKGLKIKNIPIKPTQQ
jgi:ankyrin repeat protein